ncbi:MAG: universal stress protein, partial [Thermoanaerobaculales bacterium]|nr:universal stress protein [Thermoanaerobaculales bacterium]
MKIVVGFIKNAAGNAALDRAIEEAKLRQAKLVIVHSMEGGDKEGAEEVIAYRGELEAIARRLVDLDIPHEIHEFVRGHSPSEDLIQCAHDEDADL